MLDHVRSTGNGHFDVFRHDLGIFPSLSISSTWKPHHHCARLGHGPATDRAWSPVLGGFMQKKHPNTVMWCNANIYCHTLSHLIMSTIWWVLYLQKHKHVILTDLCKYSLKHHNRKAFPMWFFSSLWMGASATPYFIVLSMSMLFQLRYNELIQWLERLESKYQF